MQNEKNVKNTANIGAEKTAPKKNAMPKSNNRSTKDGSSAKPQKSRYSRYRQQKAKGAKEEKTSMTAPKKIKLLFTIVSKQKTEFFADLLQNFEINMQMILSAQGTANEHIVSLLGLTDRDKSVIISVIRQDKIKEALAVLEEKFNTVKDGKGIAYTIPISSAIGVAIYRFLSNTTGGGIING